MTDVTKQARRKATNVTVDADLLERARALNINLSKALEERLRQLVREANEAAWLAENKEAIEAYNRRIAEEGLWSEGIRTIDEPI